jgi:hypothetical protein
MRCIYEEKENGRKKIVVISSKRRRWVLEFFKMRPAMDTYIPARENGHVL